MKKYFWFMLGFAVVLSAFPSFASADTCANYVVNNSPLTQPNGELSTKSGYEDKPQYFSAYSGEVNGPYCGIPTMGFNLWTYKEYRPSSGRNCEAEYPGQGYSTYEWQAFTVTYGTCELEPTHCTDSVKSGDETGIDCGGSCVSACSAYCPVDWLNVMDVLCASPTVPVVNGQCPPDYPNMNITDQTCQATQPVTWAGSSYNPEAVTLDNFVTFTATESTDSTKTISKVDNGDGTSTHTETVNETITSNTENDVSSTTVTTTIINNTTGEVLSETVDKDVTQDIPVDGIERSLDGIDGHGSSSVDFQPFYDLKSTLAGRFPVSLVTTAQNYFDDWVVTPEAPSWDLALNNPWGSDWSFDIDLAPMQSLASLVRNGLEMFLVICFLFMIYKRWV